MEASYSSESEQDNTLESEGSPSYHDSMVVQTIILLGYSSVSTPPSAEGNLHFFFMYDKWNLGGVILEDSWSLSIRTGHWNDTLESDWSLKTDTIVCQFRESSELNTLQSCTLVNSLGKSILSS